MAGSSACDRITYRLAGLAIPPSAPSALRSVRLHIALAAVDRAPKPVLTPVRCCHPEAFDPGGLMSHVLGVAALQVGHPVPLVVLMQGNDQALHPGTSAAEVLDLWGGLSATVSPLTHTVIISHIITTTAAAFA